MSHPAHLPALNEMSVLETLLHPSTPHQAVCLKFKATWCGPCKRIRMDELLREHPGIQWFEVDADEAGDLLDYCGVSTIPAFMAIKHGRPQPLFQSSDTKAVSEWLSDMFP